MSDETRASVVEIEALDFDDRLYLLNIEAQERHDLAVTHNVATNGRWMCALGVLVCMWLFALTFDRTFAISAVLFIAVIGLSCLADLARGFWRSAIATTVYALPALLIALLLLKLW